MEVEDTGPGIPQPERERIFSAFEQVEMRSGRHPVGVGLGLALARSIATGLGGTLVLESREGCGSTFKLRVPAGPLEAAEWVTPAETGVLPMTSATEPTPMTLQPETRHEIQGSVLVAEDSPDARALIAHALIEAGANVTVVENGEEAVEAAGKQVYDLVLMDIRMPVMDGIAATARLRRSRYLAPIIAMTASVTREDQQRIIAEGFDDLWPKPISLRQIVERASAYLRAPVIDGQKASQSRKKTAPPRSDSRYTMLVTEFARNLPERLHAIQVAVDKHDLQTAREILHQLAGTGGMMGFMRLSDEAGRVLSRIRSGICTGAGDELRVLERLIAEASDSALKSAAPNAGAPRPKA